MASSIEAIKAKVQDVLPSRSDPESDSHTIYVDTDVGADNETADGSEKKLYQSLPIPTFGQVMIRPSTSHVNP
jgi:hypothetical protein